jgi:outer membrane receptor protein involved in Fe transport
MRSAPSIRLSLRYRLKYLGMVLGLFALPPGAARAQEAGSVPPTITLRSTVLDSLSQEPLFAATVALYTRPGELPLRTTVTGEDGSFVFTALPPQAYQLRITTVGYASKVLCLPATGAPGTILLAPSAVSLSEVTVRGQKVLVQYEADKLVYNVSNDPESAALSTFEMLRKVPMLTIDADDNIELNGQASFQVLLNGRPSSLFVNSPEEALKSLPANSVKSIEVITNPPARYASEGIGGLINIITHKRTVTGYNGSVRTGFSAPGGPSTGGQLQAKAGKIGYSGLWGYSYNTRPATTNSMTRLDKRNGTTLSQNGESDGSSRSFNVGNELSWQLNDQHLINVHYNFRQFRSLSESSRRAVLHDALGEPIQSYLTLNTFDSRSPGGDWGLDYQLGFKKNSQQLLTFSYKELRNRNESENSNTIPEKINSILTSGYSENLNSFTERTAQLDYVLPFQKHTLEMGLKSITRDNYSNYFYEREDPATGQLVLDPRSSNQYDNRQAIYAGYVSASLKLSTWMLRAGARVEQTQVTANFRTTDTQARQSYFNLIPNLNLSRRFGTSTNLTASYSQRLQRPGLFYINPFINNQDPYNIYYGNPDLRATVSHVANVSFNTYKNKTNLYANLSHSFTNGAVLQYTTIGADTVARTTYGNIGAERNTGLSVGVGSTFFEKLTVNLNTNANYRRYTSRQERELVTNAGFTYGGTLTTGYAFSRYLRANATVTYTSSSFSFQSRSIGFFSHNASLNYSFLKDRKGSLSLTASNPFMPTRRNHTVTDLVQFYMVMDNVIIMHRYGLTFNYRFGKLQGGFKRNRRGISNDDLMN